MIEELDAVFLGEGTDLVQHFTARFRMRLGPPAQIGGHGHVLDAQDGVLLENLLPAVQILRRILDDRGHRHVGDYFQAVFVEEGFGLLRGQAQHPSAHEVVEFHVRCTGLRHPAHGVLEIGADADDRAEAHADVLLQDILSLTVKDGLASLQAGGMDGHFHPGIRTGRTDDQQRRSVPGLRRAGPERSHVVGSAVAGGHEGRSLDIEGQREDGRNDDALFVDDFSLQVNQFIVNVIAFA